MNVFLLICFPNAAHQISCIISSFLNLEFQAWSSSKFAFAAYVQNHLFRNSNSAFNSFTRHSPPVGSTLFIFSSPLSERSERRSESTKELCRDIVKSTVLLSSPSWTYDIKKKMSWHMGKPTICICEKRTQVSYTIPLLLLSKVSSF